MTLTCKWIAESGYAYGRLNDQWAVSDDNDAQLVTTGAGNEEATAKRVVACLNACRNFSDESLDDDCIEKLKADRDALLVVIHDLATAGKGMLERFDRSRVTGDQPMRQCRRMQDAIQKART